MIRQSKSDSSYLDRIQGKCQMIEQNLKNFKLKSRATYQKLAEEEQELMAELSALGDKFEAWAQEPPLSAPGSKPPAISGRPPVGVRNGARGKATVATGGSARAQSHVKRLGLVDRQSSAPRMPEDDAAGEPTPEQARIAEIKAEMEQVEIEII